MNKKKFIASVTKVVESYGPKLRRLAHGAKAGLTADEVDVELEDLARKADADIEFRNSLLEAIDYHVILAILTAAYIAIEREL